MNSNHQKVEKAVFDTIDQLNRQLSARNRLTKNRNELVIGEDSKLDSLGLINFLVACEQNIEVLTGQKINLTGDEMFANANSTLGTVGDFIDYISNQISNSENE